MATYRVLYWQEIPSQVKAEDDRDEMNLPLPARFISRIDQAAMERGLHNVDDYLAQWNWSEDRHRLGSAREVAEAVAAEFEAKKDW